MLYQMKGGKRMETKRRRLSVFFQEGYRARPRGVTYSVFVILSVALSAFELWLGSIGNMSPYAYAVVFLTGILPIAMITTRFSKRPTPDPSLLDYVFAAAVMASGLYLISKMDVLLSRISGVDLLTGMDIAAATIILLAVMELTRRTLGLGLTLILLVGIGYAFFGHLISGAFGHRVITVEHFIDEIVFTTNGVFGDPVQVAASYAFLFVMFGHFFQKAGAGQFIFDLCASLVGKRVGGLPKVAVTTSGLFGSISGSPSSDVATTGSINIPMMKKQGYEPVFAGAVEAAASSGGTILPPVMGSVAFLMAQFTGIPYVEIAIASVLSALLYYIGIYFQVHFRSLKLNFMGIEEKDIPNFFTTMRYGFYYVIPVGVLVWALLHGYTASLAACYGILAVFLFSFVRRSTWITVKRLLEIFVEVVYSIAPLTVATASAGIIIGVINLTGLAGKFTSLIFAITGQNILFALVVAAGICVLLGMGMPTPSVYVMAAALVAPALLQLGLDVMPVHLFLVFYAALSAITPPVGVAAFTAAGIANANPLAIGFQASKLAFVGFIIPFMFIFKPVIMLKGSIGEILFTAATAVIGVYVLAAGFEGYWRRDYLTMWKRIILMLAGVVMIYPDVIMNAVSSIVIAVMLISERVRQIKGIARRSTAPKSALVANSSNDPQISYHPTKE